MGGEQQQNASAIVLRPVSDMRNITSHIAASDVSDASVQQTLQAAEDGLNVANSVQNTTSTAV